MHALHAVASYGQNMAPHFIIQAKASMPKVGLILGLD
jgi:hypothetical protein